MARNGGHNPQLRYTTRIVGPLSGQPSAWGIIRNFGWGLGLLLRKQIICCIVTERNEAATSTLFPCSNGPFAPEKDLANLCIPGI